MIKLEKGAKVRVRLHTGEVVEAVYDMPDIDKDHWVLVKEKPYLASKNNNFFRGCRFVGNPCVHLPVGVSV